MPLTSKSVKFIQTKETVLNRMNIVV